MSQERDDVQLVVRYLRGGRWLRRSAILALPLEWVFMLGIGGVVWLALGAAVPRQWLVIPTSYVDMANNVALQIGAVFAIPASVIEIAGPVWTGGVLVALVLIKLLIEPWYDSALPSSLAWRRSPKRDAVELAERTLGDLLHERAEHRRMAFRYAFRDLVGQVLTGLLIGCAAVFIVVVLYALLRTLDGDPGAVWSTLIAVAASMCAIGIGALSWRTGIAVGLRFERMVFGVIVPLPRFKNDDGSTIRSAAQQDPT